MQISLSSFSKITSSESVIHHISHSKILKNNVIFQYLAVANDCFFLRWNYVNLVNVFDSRLSFTFECEHTVEQRQLVHCEICSLMKQERLRKMAKTPAVVWIGTWDDKKLKLDCNLQFFGSVAINCHGGFISFIHINVLTSENIKIV